MDPHEDDLRNVVEPRTDAERVELEAALAEYEADRAERAKVIHLADYGDQYAQAVARADSELALRQPAEVAPVEDTDPVVYVPERQKRSVVEAWGRLMPSAEALQQARSGQLFHVAKQTGRRVGLAFYTVTRGHTSWLRRAVDGMTHGHLRQAVQQAHKAGDRRALAEASDRLEQAKNNRANRLKALPDTIKGIFKVGLIVIATLMGLVLVVITILKAKGGLDEAQAVFGTVGALVVWVFSLLGEPWALPLMVGGWLWIAYREGVRTGQPPRWLATASGGDLDVTIDETTIANALRALRIPQITDYLKAGLHLQFLTTARRDGRGTHAVARLPSGVTAEKIARRRADLATGLHRLAKEVWPTTGSEAGILDLWVADKGALAEGAGPHPLLDDGLVDVFKGIPFGKTLRGDPVVAPVMERNTIVGGIPGQGKSAAARTLMTGAALDPTAELRIWVPDANFDFEVFRPRCSRYVMGAENEKIAEILEHLRELHAEVQERGALLVRYEIPEVTRELAGKGVGLHPLFCLLEEAHVAITHPKYGDEIAGLLVDVVRLGRKRGIHMIVSTQSPTKDNMPRDVTRNCSNGIAFAVGDHVANDGLLGQGAYAGGHRATELIVGADRGTAVVKGFAGERSQLVQGYFLSVDGKHNQVTPMIDRALDAIAERGAVPGTDRDTPEIEAPRVFLDDLHEAMRGEDRVLVQTVLGRLGELDATYHGWAPGRLKAACMAEGFEPRKLHGGRMHVVLDDVEAARS